jgi:hypothetical protein
MVGSSCRLKQFTTGSRNSLKDVRKSQLLPTRPPCWDCDKSNCAALEGWIRADRRITIDSVATSLGCSHGLVCSIMHDRLRFRKECPENWRIEKKWTEWVCPRSISYVMQMKEKLCLTGLSRGTNHGCIATNPNQSVLQCNGNIPLHLQPKSLKLRHQPGRLCLPCFGNIIEYR